MSKLLTAVTCCCLWLSGTMPAKAQVTPNRDSADYYFQRGASFYEDRRQPTAWRNSARRRAMAYYTKSIAFDSSYYWAYRNRGYCHQNFGEYELALADYEQAVVAGERSGEADAAFEQYDCIDMCVQLAKWAEAEAHCSALLANPHLCTATPTTDCRSVWLNRADARVNLKKYREARQDYLIYQEQTVAELAIERQKPAPARAKQTARHLSKRERASLADWGESPPNSRK